MDGREDKDWKVGVGTAGACLKVTGLSRADHILKPRGDLSKLSRYLHVVICYLLLIAT